ncbi:MAG: hypothetical protein EAZ70_00480 [Runella slithyformis]|nr:MAG: hypothetical protein EAY79_00875 [Runella slithyformis]TAF30021.1 MAG: hypothetical protein EAZ70_00480 [Runella slithyformis]TAF49137.1 MAG: hypothetical protein EAZ63_02545 [Runella slithyformis]TAF83632.1 MAG: hypothetical protein EAZ50_00635 [Runella slithyformis]
MHIAKNWIFALLTTPTLVSVWVGLVLVAWHTAGGGLPLAAQIAFTLLFVGLTGIPHGAIDHLVAQETAKRTKKNFTIVVFIVKYLLIMLVYAGAWWWLPSTSLLFFLLISAWHFGETDIENAPPTFLWNFVRLFSGSLVLGYLILTHFTETTPVLARISQYNSDLLAAWAVLVANKTVVLLGAGVALMGAYGAAYAQQPIVVDKMRLLRLLLILVATYFLPLMVAFALYFGGWHALCAFNTIKNYIVEPNAKTLNTIKLAFSVWAKTLLFTSIAVAFLGFSTWYWFNYLNNNDPLPPLFIFLSLITLPHLTVMHDMNKRAN